MVFRPCGDYGGGYADCFPQNGSGSGGGHHFYESVESGGMESFRLRGDLDRTAPLNDDTSSIASKKRIDSMFCKVTGRTGDDYNSDCGYGGGADNNNNNKNTVQEKIEKMFAEISSSGLDTELNSAAAAGADNSISKYHVQYIGCADLSAKISSLEGLQQPVRDMYFGYRESRHRLRDERTDGTRSDFSGLLEISAAGLSIRYRDDAGDAVHRTNPFPSIAVWAALKYVCRRRSPAAQRRTRTAAAAAVTQPGYEYAFLPLIADPDGSDKAPLFRHMDDGDRVRLDAAGDHAPVFAVVTRKTGKRLECHGFACETENDALLMAANLYGALVAAMSAVAAAAEAADAGKDDGGRERAAEPSARRVIRQRNGFTSMSSTAGSIAGDGDVQAPALPPPPRPPRRNKKSASSSVTSSVTDTTGTGEGRASIGLHDGDVCSDEKTFRMTVRQPSSLRRGVCNSSSGSAAIDARSSSIGSGDVRLTVKQQQRSGGGGDIFTKVAIPRSRSFLNSNGLASSKYSRRAAGCGIETAANGPVRRRSNGSGVMGFADMFNELRVQEGLNNMDDILHAIINADGMSYNDLKPVYREFLMKLAMTLTKDELYLRTKAIMTEQKRKRRRNKRRRPSSVQATSRARRLNDKLRGAFDLRAAKTRIVSAFWPNSCRRAKKRTTAAKRSRTPRRRCSCSANGSSSVDVRPIGRKNRRDTVAPHRTGSTSDDSDGFFALHRQRQHAVKLQQLQQQRQQYRKPSKTTDNPGSGPRRGRAATSTASEGGGPPRLHRASSGYFSCSECSATDDCKYYCGDHAEPTSLVSCSCDSDSCADSDKCYCGRPRRPRNIFDELKSRGFAASESSASRADSPGTAWKKNEELMLLHGSGGGDDVNCPGGGGSAAATATGGIGIEPSKSLEYLQVTRRRPRPVDQNYSTVVKPADRTSAAAAAVMRAMMKTAYGSTGSTTTTTAAGSSSSLSSSSSAGHHRPSHRKHRGRSGSSGSDNFRAIDYALFATDRRSGRMRSEDYRDGGGRRPTTTRNAVDVNNRRSYSTEAVHLTGGGGGGRVYHQNRGHRLQQPATTRRRHSVHDGGFTIDDASPSSFFKSDIENSLGYYP